MTLSIIKQKIIIILSQHNDTEYYATEHNDTNHYNEQNYDTQQNNTQHYDVHHNHSQNNDAEYMALSIMTLLSIIILRIMTEHNGIRYHDTQHNITVYQCIHV